MRDRRSYVVQMPIANVRPVDPARAAEILAQWCELMRRDEG